MQIDIATRRIEEVDTEHAVTLVLSGGANVRIESPFDIWEVGAEPTTLDPVDLSSGIGLWHWLRGRVVEADLPMKNPDRCASRSVEASRSRCRRSRFRVVVGELAGWDYGRRAQAAG